MQMRPRPFPGLQLHVRRPAARRAFGRGSVYSEIRAVKHVKHVTNLFVLKAPELVVENAFSEDGKGMPRLCSVEMQMGRAAFSVEWEGRERKAKQTDFSELSVLGY